jgi:FKBP12-rapamycin complex-associated protein
MRKNALKRQQYRKIYEEIQKGLRLTNPEAIHGSLLALKEIFNCNAARYAEGRYQDLCEIVLRYKDHRDILIRKTVMLMIPDLTKLDVQEFVITFFPSSMNYLLSQLKKEKERSTAFMSIGKIALVVGSNISSHLDGILAAIKESLILKG